MSSSIQNPQQRKHKRERSASPETEVNATGRSRQTRRLKKPKTIGKDNPASAAIKEETVHLTVSETKQDALPDQKDTLSNEEQLRRMMESDDEDMGTSPPHERTLRKAKHIIRERIDIASNAQREMEKAVAKFDEFFSRLVREHVYATTREELTAFIGCIPGCTSRIVNCTYVMKAELRILDLGVEGKGDLAQVRSAIIAIETAVERIDNNYSQIINELKMATTDRKLKGPKGFDDIQRINATMQELSKGFGNLWRDLLRYADLVGAERDSEFEKAEPEEEDDED